MSDFDIVIAHRGEPSQLWFTVQSICMEMERSKFDYKFYFCINGDVGAPPESWVMMKDLKRVGRIGWLHHEKNPLAPPAARQMAVAQGDAPIIAFFDSHALLAPDYFKRAMLDFEYKNCDLLHSAYKFYHHDVTCFHYKSRLAINFWASSETDWWDIRPYKIAAGGHGGFFVKRSVWEELGGYWDGFVGYGGEEMYFDLKAALLDKTNWLDPQIIHYHYAGNRGYARHYTDDYYTNMMAVAHIIGGQKWMDTVFNSFSSNTFKIRTGNTMFDLYQTAFERSKEHAAWMRKNEKRSLDEQLEKFREEDIPF